MESEATFGRWMRLYREELGLSQAALAAQVGLDPSAITRIERGSRSIRLNEAVEIAGALCHSISDMIRDPQSDLHGELARGIELLTSVNMSIATLVKERDALAASLVRLREQLGPDQPDETSMIAEIRAKSRLPLHELLPLHLRERERDG